MSDIELPHEMLEPEDNAKPDRDKHVALVISVLALLLALTEILGQSVQISAVENNIEAANRWAFFQARAERETTYAVGIDAVEALLPNANEQTKPALTELVAKWRKASARLHDDPQKKAGTVQLFNSAKAAEEERDRAEKKHRRYELASAALHIGIVLASASIITGMPLLVSAALWLGGAAGLLILAGVAA